MIREDTFIFKVNIIRNQLKIILNMISYYKKIIALKHLLCLVQNYIDKQILKWHCSIMLKMNFYYTCAHF